MEAILNYDSDSLHIVKSLISKERAAVAEKLAQQERQADAMATDSMNTTLALVDNDAKPATRSSGKTEEQDIDVATLAGLGHYDDFDSGAETDREEGSQITDMSESD